jgi:hypothetical protein
MNVANSLPGRIYGDCANPAAVLGGGTIHLAYEELYEAETAKIQARNEWSAKGGHLGRIASDNTISDDELADNVEDTSPTIGEAFKDFQSKVKTFNEKVEAYRDFQSIHTETLNKLNEITRNIQPAELSRAAREEMRKRVAFYNEINAVRRD